MTRSSRLGASWAISGRREFDGDLELVEVGTLRLDAPDLGPIQLPHPEPGRSGDRCCRHVQAVGEMLWEDDASFWEDDASISTDAGPSILGEGVGYLLADGLFVPVAESGKGEQGQDSVEPRDEVHGSTPEAGADDVEESNEPRLEFVELPVPSREDLTELAENVARRITALVEKLSEAEEARGRLGEATGALRESLMKAMSAPSSVKQLSLAEQDHEGGARENRALCVKVAGFTLHTGQSTSVDGRNALGRLCRYGLRAPFSQGRLSLREDR